MNEPHSTKDAHCPPETVLEEWAMGRLDDQAASMVVRHMEGCPTCTRSAHELKAECDSIHERLSPRRPVAESPCAAETELARFLDGSLESHARKELQKHLSDCRRCQTRLVDLYQELEYVRSDTPLETTHVAAPEPPVVEFPKKRDSSLHRVMAEPAWAMVLLAVAALTAAALAPGFRLHFQFLTLFAWGFLVYAAVKRRPRPKWLSPFTERRGLIAPAGAALYVSAWLFPAASSWLLLAAGATLVTGLGLLLNGDSAATSGVKPSSAVRPSSPPGDPSSSQETSGRPETKTGESHHR